MPKLFVEPLKNTDDLGILTRLKRASDNRDTRKIKKQKRLTSIASMPNLSFISEFSFMMVVESFRIESSLLQATNRLFS